MMYKVIALLSAIFITATTGAFAATARNAASFVQNSTYDNMYPFMNNRMRTELDPGVSPNRAAAQITTMTRTSTDTGATANRRVVPRSAKSSTTTARSSIPTTTATQNVARSATPATGATATSNNRRVVARRQATTARSARGDNSYISRTADSATNTIKSTTETLPSSRCLADYTECMNGYCQREKTAYNRCYCSAKLSQIDATYQTSIDSLIKQILTLRSTNAFTQQEMDEYWMDTVGKFSGENSWTNLENALNIDWASTESRVRGQQAFATGHEYCVQHLRGCYYMAANLRDAYRSEIARDCNTYETSLQKIKNAAESILESYK